MNPSTEKPLNNSQKPRKDWLSLVDALPADEDFLKERPDIFDFDENRFIDLLEEPENNASDKEPKP